MGCCCSRVKSTIRQLFMNNKNEHSIDSGMVQRSPLSIGRVYEARNDGDGEGFLSGSFADFSAPVPASEKLCHIGSWPAWKRQLDSRLGGSIVPSMSWILKRVPDPSPFESLRKLEDLLAALEFSYDNCIFEGPYRSGHPDSVLYCTSIGRIAKFGCCPQCKSIAGTVRSDFPHTLLEPYSRNKEVVIWCADWGSLEADEANEAVVAKAFQDGSYFLTIGENVPKLLEMFESANEECFRRR